MAKCLIQIRIKEVLKQNLLNSSICVAHFERWLFKTTLSFVLPLPKIQEIIRNTITSQFIYLAKCFRDIKKHSRHFCLIRSFVHTFILTEILIKTMSSKFHGHCANSFADSAKVLHFLRFHNSSRNRFVYTRKVNQLFIFLIALAKHVNLR